MLVLKDCLALHALPQSLGKLCGLKHLEMEACHRQSRRRLLRIGLVLDSNSTTQLHTVQT
jgi:hypothetical protein